ncbi:ethionine resistance protein [Tieghemiomyces parasiticus]|uniref:Ethionine resistance protein n=1 Tax=Tieghemiomyces parasiticus TaxID=78921 RepID=A0A9W8A832_9FUNG|nr:ethionine resistance protein [Tieghemiomyces parasiticus]
MSYSTLPRIPSRWSQSDSQASTSPVSPDEGVVQSVIKIPSTTYLGVESTVAPTPQLERNTADPTSSERAALLASSSSAAAGSAADAPDQWAWRDVHCEARTLGRLSAPITLAASLQILNILVPGMVLGRLGTDAIAASALAMSVASFSAAAPLIGLLSALDTLCSQAATGSSRPGLPGIYLQRCLLLCIASFIPSVILWWNIHPIFIYLRQDPVIAAMAARYLRYVTFSLFFTLAFESIKKFFIAQGFHHAISLVQVLGTPITLASVYFLAVHPATSIGYVGIPASVAISYALSSLMAFAWLKTYGGSRGWTGLSWEAFRGWGRMARLAVPGAIMVSSEIVALDLLTVATSYLGPTALAAQAIVSMTIQSSGTLLMGLSAVTANRVGNLLGLAQPHRARNAAMAALGCGTIVGIVLGVTLYSLRGQWSYVFNPDPEVHAIVKHMIPLLASLLALTVITALSLGILRGQGRPKIGAYMNLASFYLVAAPVGFLTLRYTSMGIVGLWLSFSMAVFTSGLGQLFFLLRTNWYDQVLKCEARLAHDGHQEGLLTPEDHLSA